MFISRGKSRPLMSFDVRVEQKSLGKVTELVGQNSLVGQSSHHGISSGKWTAKQPFLA
jgi:hypothetical protein